jgi:hypothetical protein
MGPYIMDHFIDRERLRGLMVMARAFVFFECHSLPNLDPLSKSSYRTLTLPFLQKTLAIETLEDTRTFLAEHRVGSFFTNPSSPDSEKIIDCKSMSSELSVVYEEKYRKVAIKGAI